VVLRPARWGGNRACVYWTDPQHARKAVAERWITGTTPEDCRRGPLAVSCLRSVSSPLWALVWLTPALANLPSADPLLHARWIVDFTVGNPVLLISGVLLWRHAGLGYTTAAALLLLSGANGLTFAIGGVVGALLTTTPVEVAVIAMHVVIAVLCFGVLGVLPARTGPASGTSAVFIQERTRA
jgi:hypothetical protein